MGASIPIEKEINICIIIDIGKGIIIGIGIDINKGAEFSLGIGIILVKNIDHGKINK